MKKITLLLFALFMASTLSFAAVGIQGTLKYSPSGTNAIIVSIKNNTTSTITRNIVGFVSAIRVASNTPDPSIVMTLTSNNPNSGTFATTNYIYTEGGYTYYDVNWTNGQIPVNLAPGAEWDLAEIKFSGGLGSTTVELVDRGNTGLGGGGGPLGNTNFYINLDGADNPATSSNDWTDTDGRFYNGPNSTGLSNSSQFSIVGLGGVVLPVKYTHIEARKSGSNAIITWGTATEQNNTGFDIERSADGKNFTKVGHQKSLAENGNSSSNLEYSFTDAQPLAGVNYYRLKQINTDGKGYYSTVVNVTFGAAVKNVYPNPAKTQLTVTASGVSLVEVFTVTGQKVSVPVTYNTGNAELNISALANGNYILRVVSGTEVSAQQILVQH